MTPPDDDIDLLWIAIAEKTTELEGARILLKEFVYPNKVVRHAHLHTSAQLGCAVHKLCT